MGQRDFVGLRTLVASGWACTLTGLVGQALTLWPPQWSRPEWEVAYVGEFSATVGLLVIGLGILGMTSLIRGSRVGSWIVGGSALVLGGWALLGALVTALDIPLVVAAARTAATPQQADGMRIVAVKAVLLSGCYGVGLVALAVASLRTGPVRAR